MNTNYAQRCKVFTNKIKSKSWTCGFNGDVKLTYQTGSYVLFNTGDCLAHDCADNLTYAHGVISSPASLHLLKPRFKTKKKTYEGALMVNWGKLLGGVKKL